MDIDSAMEAAEEAGFTVVGEKITLDEMNDITFDEKTLLPPSDNVRLVIKRVDIRVNDEKTKKTLNVLWQVVDGIDVDGVIKYKNATFFQNGASWDKYVFYADPSVFTSAYYTERKYLKALKELIVACKLDGFDPDKVVGDFVGKEVIAKIEQKTNEKFNAETGAWVPDGTFNNFASNLKPYSGDGGEATTL